MLYLFQKDHSGSSEKHDLERQTRGIVSVLGWDKNWRRRKVNISGEWFSVLAATPTVKPIPG